MNRKIIVQLFTPHLFADITIDVSFGVFYFYFVSLWIEKYIMMHRCMAAINICFSSDHMQVQALIMSIRNSMMIHWIVSPIHYTQ